MTEDLPPIVLLHGLGGHAGEWEPLARMLRDRYRVIAPDQRGHGSNSHRTGDLSRSAFVADAVAVMEDATAPVTLVGQSMGAHTALLAAAARPDLVSRLVLLDGGVGGDGGEATDRVIAWFGAWPVPFATPSAAVAFFGGGPVGEAWAAGLRETSDGLVPRFDVDALRASLDAVHERARWEEWRAITCPVLLVRAGRGVLTHDEADRMLRENPRAELVTIPDSGHDVHLEATGEVAALLRNLPDPD